MENKTSKLTLTALVLLASTISLHAHAVKKVTISSVGETMTFDKASFDAKAGEEIQLTLKNNSTTLEHNWVHTQPGKDQEVASAGIAAGASKNWLDETHPGVIAYTAMIKPKKSETIKFKAPAAKGDYPYVCTFPGHNTMMTGTLKVK